MKIIKDTMPSTYTTKGTVAYLFAWGYAPLEKVGNTIKFIPKPIFLLEVDDKRVGLFQCAQEYVISYSNKEDLETKMISHLKECATAFNKLTKSKFAIPANVSIAIKKEDVDTLIKNLT